MNNMRDIYRNIIRNLLLSDGYDPVIVAKKTSSFFLNNQTGMDKDFYNKMLDIMTMEDGSEFEMTEEEFKKFLDEM